MGVSFKLTSNVSVTSITMSSPMFHISHVNFFKLVIYLFHFFRFGHFKVMFFSKIWESYRTEFKFKQLLLNLIQILIFMLNFK